MVQWFSVPCCKAIPNWCIFFIIALFFLYEGLSRLREGRVGLGLWWYSLLLSGGESFSDCLSHWNPLLPIFATFLYCCRILRADREKLNHGEPDGILAQNSHHVLPLCVNEWNKFISQVKPHCLWEVFLFYLQIELNLPLSILFSSLGYFSIWMYSIVYRAKHYNKLFINTSHLTPMTASSAGVINDILQLGKLKPRKVKWLFQNYTTRKWQRCCLRLQSFTLNHLLPNKHIHMWVPSSFLKVRTASSLSIACSIHGLWHTGDT